LLAIVNLVELNLTQDFVRDIPVDYFYAERGRWTSQPTAYTCATWHSVCFQQMN